jgi:hypothetical protein
METTQPQVAVTLHKLAIDEARQMLEQALACKVKEYVERHQDVRDLWSDEG